MDVSESEKPKKVRQPRSRNTPCTFDFTRLWDEDLTAAYLGNSSEFLQQDRIKKVPRIPFIRVGRCIRYDPRDVLEFLERNRVVAVAAA